MKIVAVWRNIVASIAIKVLTLLHGDALDKGLS
jgi:hypothetical protein